MKRLRPDTNLLMVLATAGAVAIGHWFEATSTMFLFSFAEFLENWNMARAQRAIRFLMDLAPATAQVLGDDGSISERRVEDVPIGATIVDRERKSQWIPSSFQDRLQLTKPQSPVSLCQSIKTLETLSLLVLSMEIA